MQKKALTDLNLTDCFLYFSDKNQADFFYDSLIYICEHDNKGAFGLIVNQPLKLTTHKLFKSLQLNSNNLKHDLDRVMQGGPVDGDKVFVLHSKDSGTDFSSKLSNNLYLSTDAEILKRIAEQRNLDFKVFLGYCGWGAQQLEQELNEGVWEVVNTSREKIFDTKPTQLVDRISNELGYNLRDISKGSKQTH
ncbi:MAG: YqgE/AlgH family protein [Gammaproteobacteria bacterium]